MNAKARKLLSDSCKLASTPMLKSELKHHKQLLKAVGRSKASSKHAAAHGNLKVKLHHKETCQIIYGELVKRKHSK